MASTKIYTSLEKKPYKHFHEIKPYNKLAMITVFLQCCLEDQSHQKLKGISKIL